MDVLLHAAMRAAEDRLLFKTWWEARALWDRCIKVPGLVTLTLMPDHLHALLKAIGLAHLAVAMRGHALWLNRTRGLEGAVWRHRDRPVELKDRKHARRSSRYSLLNPCRAGLVEDPLAWPFSTHRDAVGLAIPPARRRVSDPGDFHAYVSGDPSVRPGGTSLPEPALGLEPRPARPSEVITAVSALTRTPVDKLTEDEVARVLLARAARVLAGMKVKDVMDLAAMSRRSVQRLSQRRDADLLIVERVIGDPRFASLQPGDLRQLPTWSRYRRLQ
jgi:putative transposase